MKKYLERSPGELKKVIRQAAQISQKVGMPAYLVGGCLRDLMLGVKNSDLDITVEGDGILFAGALAKKLKSELAPLTPLKKKQRSMLRVVIFSPASLKPSP